MEPSHINSSSPSKVLTRSLRAESWYGSIPVCLSLAPSSLSSPSMPPSIHCMIPRMSYLHVGLRKPIRRMYRSAPTPPMSSVVQEDYSETTTTTNGNDEAGTASPKKTHVERLSEQYRRDDDEHAELPVCWLEDVRSGIALRWQLFAGVLYDLLKYHYSSAVSDRELLPWHLRVHFTSYPSHLLPLEQHRRTPLKENRNNDGDARGDVMSSRPSTVVVSVPVLEVMRQHFSNSLKQALFLHHGSARVAMTKISRQSHVTLWDAVLKHKREQFWEVVRDLIINHGEFGKSQKRETEPQTSSSSLLPVRLLVDGRPAVQRPIGGPQTLGQLFLDCLPDLVFDDKDNRHVEWDVQGIRPPLSTSINDLWYNLCYPDLFLYITVVTTSGL